MDSNNEIVLSREYTPYGETLSSVGSFETEFGYTGELTDGNGLINLRARYYDPSTGRFLTKDSWAGDNRTPVTLVKWLYANSNPVMYTDPSGYCFDSNGKFHLFGGPLLGQCSTTNSSNGIATVTPSPTFAATPMVNPTFAPTATAFPTPNIYDYDPTVEPRGITWNPSMHVPFSPSIPINAKQAQYKPKYRGPMNEDMGGNLCGLIDLTMISQAASKSGDILYNLWKIGLGGSIDPYDGTTLITIAMKALPGNWKGKSYSWGWTAYADTFHQGIYSWQETSWTGTIYGTNTAIGIKDRLNQNHYLIALVQSRIVDGYDQVVPFFETGHWVIITGLSGSWNSVNEESEWNWVRINNPFNNRVEYYPWKDFKKSFDLTGYSMVELWQNYSPANDKDPVK